MYKTRENFAPYIPLPGEDVNEPEPNAEPTAEPTAEPNAEPAAEPTAEPNAEPTPTPAPKPAPTPAPIPASASVPAPIKKGKETPTNFAGINVAFKPLLDVDAIKTTNTFEEKIVTRQKTMPSLATKEIQIVIPKKQTSKCIDDIYNSHKTLTGNVIDAIMCNVQDFNKKIANFF